ncbi:hypothetical protein [Arthrobacter sp. H14-L1]|uniref:hypothetical protein n=1 Tax=Arthrobacter sp. H14-L1 TaxID=2996697 RepID=UPI00226E2625|nr:hypothetical protein [Arthrobacter sp. H14-L1]
MLISSVKALSAQVLRMDTIAVADPWIECSEFTEKYDTDRRELCGKVPQARINAAMPQASRPLAGPPEKEPK